ncbi:MAG: hypothetical protein E7543_06820 [Ruminococcaceae bacterium]|nr:hypothetical protein [Oscillospiraceae bacterium]MBQ9912988.1 hypothetical protein [Clostridia bacterium]
MQSSAALIDAFIKTITDSDVLNSNCSAIRAYESKNLPVPIKKTYFSFSALENKLYYSADESGKKTEVNSVRIAVNCFIPLTLSPAVTHTLTESVMLMLMKSNSSIVSFTVGKTEYDSDVDAFRINSELLFQTEKQI